MTCLRNKNFVKQVMIRDLGLCRCCGFKAKEVHHVTPLIFGGEDIPSNMISLCETCHQFAPNTKKDFYNYLMLGGAKTKIFLGIIAQQAEIAEKNSGGALSFAFNYNLGKNIMGWLRDCDRNNNLESIEKKYICECFNIPDVDWNDKTPLKYKLNKNPIKGDNSKRLSFIDLS
jgi:hypothetical protein